MKILDPRFKYVPAVATDVSLTWKRFGFSPQANVARRAKVWSGLLAPALARSVRPALLLLCSSRSGE